MQIEEVVGETYGPDVAATSESEAEETFMLQVDYLIEVTPRAILLLSGHSKLWVPRSVICENDQVKRICDGGKTLTVKRWFAVRRGWCTG